MDEKISVKNLPFEAVPSSKAENLKYRKGLLGGTKKKFAECILNGKATFYPVMVEDTVTEYVRGLADSGDEDTYCILKTRDGRDIKEEVFCSPAAEFRGISAFVDENLEDKNITYPGYIIHFFISGIEHYIVVDEKEFADLNITIAWGSFILSFDSLK